MISEHELIAPRIALFFTRGMSLRAWDECGLLSREVALYRLLQDRGIDVVFVTYGGPDELRYAEHLPCITICCNQWGLPQWLYERLLPWLHRDVLRSVDLIKTNQTYGADVALRCARWWRKPLIARCGFMWSDFCSRQAGARSILAARSVRLERLVFQSSQRIVVTTEEMRNYVNAHFPHSLANKVVIPNYVDIDLFSPGYDMEKADIRFCYVGRLDQDQKNLRSLIAAVRDLDVDLDIIGDGPLREELEAESRQNPRLHLLGKVPNHHLPGFLKRATGFVLPSFYEGHPKALLEAMACGLPVIGTDVSGVREIIRHGETGWLCQTDAESLRGGVLAILSDPSLRKHLGRNAREFVCRHFSLAHIVEEELKLYQGVMGTL